MSINLKWSPRVIGDSQKVYRSESPFNVDSLPSVLATVGASDIDYADTTETAGLAYYYAISTVLGSREVLSQVINITASGEAVDAPWSPAELFAASEEGAWFDMSDLSSMWTDLAKTTNVSADGDFVRAIDDKSGNGHHLIVVQDVDSWSPIYRTDGTLHWLEFDGASKQIGAAHGLTIGDFLITAGGREEGAKGIYPVFFTAGVPNANPPRLLAITDWYDGNYYLDTYNASSGRIGGTAPKGVDEDMMFTMARTGSAVTAFESAVSLGTATEGTAISGSTAFYLGSGSSLNFYEGRMYGFVAVFAANDTTDKDNLEAYMAEKSGVTL